MKILVAGGRGQLGRSLAPTGAITVAHAELDVTNDTSIATALAAYEPAVVINAAGYTAVDLAETERVRAFAINAEGAGRVARACAARGIRSIFVSTDYVFDGTATAPLREDATPAPINAYGESKRAGEEQVLAAGGTVVRTSWLFGEGGPSFVHAILRRARAQAELRVVADQWGCPTYTGHLARALLAIAERTEPAQVWHVCDGEPTTWHAFAQAIVGEDTRIAAITTAEYPTPARRPAYSVLSCEKARAAGIPLGAWRDGLRAVLAAERA